MLAEWPILCPADWLDFINEPQSNTELESIRSSVNRGTLFGNDDWQASIANQLGLRHRSGCVVGHRKWLAPKMISDLFFILHRRHSSRSLYWSLTYTITSASMFAMANPKINVLDGLRHRGDEPHLLREVFRTYQVLMSGFARQTGVPASRFALMRLLALSEGDIGLVELARQLGINSAAVTRQVQELETEHLVKRRADAKDGRRSYVTLSPKGRKQFEEIHERTHELERSLSSALGAEAMAAAATTLANLRTYLEGLR